MTDGVTVVWDEPDVRVRTADMPDDFGDLLAEAEEYFANQGNALRFVSDTAVIAHVRHRYTNYEDAVRGLWEGEPRQQRSRATFDRVIRDALRTKYGAVVGKYRSDYDG